MTWTPRQRAMLAEMGLRVWTPPASADVAVPTPATLALAPLEVPETEPMATPAVSESPAIQADVATLAQRLTQTGRRPEGVSQMDWATLQTTVSACTACQLCESRTQAVFGVGHPQARVMVVGEAPGEQEDLQGEPFVGPSGKLLDLMLASIGLTRQESDAQRQVFIANVLKCRPPRNRNPSPEEVVQCEPYLLRQVQLVQPQLIVAMGRFAIESLLKTTDSVGKLRGRLHHYAEVPVVVTYHPAYLLRQPAEKAKAWADLLLAARVLQQKNQA